MRSAARFRPVSLRLLATVAAVLADDDAGQSSDISITDPQYLVVAVGW